MVSPSFPSTLDSFSARRYQPPMIDAHAPQTAFGRGLLLFAVLAVPLLFCTATVEAFELPKLLLLVSLAILIGAVAVARAEWSLAALGRPLPIAVMLFLTSAVLSTIFSVQPLTSVLGIHE